MTLFLIVNPMRIAAVAASRGTGAANLATVDPKEVWIDTAVGSDAVLTIDLGAARSIDTILLGSIGQSEAATTWRITGGVGGAAEVVILDTAALRVPDVEDDWAPVSHALWHGPTRVVRYLAITTNQPAAAAALSAGLLVIGRAFAPELGPEWGGGRRPVDTGSATALPSGGFAVVEGVRKRALSCTFGDLQGAEADQLERIALALGETRPGLVIEDASPTAGLVARIHYGLFQKWRAYERRNRAQTRWEIEIEDWV